MKIMAVICNLVLFGFTCLVLVTDGPPTKPGYIVFTIWSLATPILNSVVISLSGARRDWLDVLSKRTPLKEETRRHELSSPATAARTVAIVVNVILLGFICWALVDQFPHPEEDGFIAFTLLMILTPVLSVVVIFGGRKLKMEPQPAASAPK